MLTLAGVCFFAAMSHGPDSYRLRGADPEDDHPEHQEAAEEYFRRDLGVTIQFLGAASMGVRDGNYDEIFEPEFQAVVSSEDDRPTVRPLSGFKRPSGPEVHHG